MYFFRPGLDNPRLWMVALAFPVFSYFMQCGSLVFNPSGGTGRRRDLNVSTVFDFVGESSHVRRLSAHQDAAKNDTSLVR